MQLTTPDNQDWAVRVFAVTPQPAPPSAASARLHSTRDAAISLKLALWDIDAPTDYIVEIVQPPRNGKLSGTGAERTYIPNPGFTGRDSFQWHASGAGWTSNAAEVVISANASGENRPPQVDDQRVSVRADGELFINLRYTDPDGPGPHFWTVRRPPQHGLLTGRDNDVMYKPEPGFTGTDTFTWAVSDGMNRSRDASVTVTVR